MPPSPPRLHTIYHMPLPDKTLQLSRPSARFQVYEQLRQWIENGTLAPGEVIKDLDIAARLGVSRTPVREALQMLEQVRAVETAPSHRTRVAGARPSDAALVYAPLSALHAVAAEEAVARATEDDVRAMSTANSQLLEAAAGNDPVSAREADYRFHHVLVKRTANPYLANAIESLQIHSRRLDTLYFTNRAPTRESYREHELIIKAILQKDAVACREITRRNYLRSIDVLVRP